VELLGLSIERSYSELQPTRNVRPTGRRSSSCNGNPTIEIFRNGVLADRFTAPPGPVDLSDLAGTDLSSNVTIYVEDPFGPGADRHLHAEFGHRSARGRPKRVLLERWSARDPFDVGFAYSEEAALSGFYARGLGSGMTVSANFLASENVSNAGAGMALPFARGIAIIDAAASTRQGGDPGAAAGLLFRGGPYLAAANDVLTVRLDYRTREYVTAGLFDLFGSAKWDVSADYRFDISEYTTLTFGGSYLETLRFRRRGRLGLRRRDPAFRRSARLRHRELRPALLR
jgi:outer membrane usher protein FimD/PapC